MRKVMVTGCNTGIGLGLVKELLQQKYEVIACVRKPEYFGFLYEELRTVSTGGGILHLRAFDLASDFSQELQNLHQELGTPDILINNAGVFLEDGATYDHRRKSILDSLEINLFSVMRICDFFAPYMKSLDWGRIVNVSSLMGSLKDNRSGGYLAYRLSKASLNMYTVNLARAFDSHKVRVMAVHPGWIRTRMGGIQAPDEIPLAVDRILYCLSDEADSRHGEFLIGNQSLPW